MKRSPAKAIKSRCTNSELERHSSVLPIRKASAPSLRPVYAIGSRRRCKGRPYTATRCNWSTWRRTLAMPSAMSSMSDSSASRVTCPMAMPSSRVTRSDSGTLHHAELARASRNVAGFPDRASDCRRSDAGGRRRPVRPRHARRPRTCVCPCRTLPA